MKKVYCLFLIVFLSFSFQSNAQTSIDIGQDYNGSSVINPSSGVLLVANTTSYTIPGDNEIRVHGETVISRYDDGSYGARGVRYTYIQINAGGYIEVALTNNSKSKIIKGLKLNGTSGSTSVNISSLPVLFSDQYPFNDKRIIGHDATGVLPFARSGGSGFTLNNIPEGCKSFRIYRDVKLKEIQAGFFEVDLIDGDITLGQTSQVPRIAYIRVDLEDEPLMIKEFTINGYTASIDQNLKTISLVLPAGTDVSALTPELSLSGGATHYTPTGEQDFSPDTIIYTVFDANTQIPYKVAVEASAVADAVNTIASLSINNRAAEIDDDKNTIRCVFPSFSAPLAAWQVNFSLTSELSSANFVSGSTHDFSTGPLQLTVTAQSGEERVYTVKAVISEKEKSIALLTSNGRIADYDSLLLLSFADYFVDLIRPDNVASANVNSFFAQYDLLVIHSNVSHTNATMVALRSQVGKVPVLNLNAQMYASNSWNWGTPANGGPYSNQNYDVYIHSSLQDHPIFADVALHQDEHATIRKAMKYYTDAQSVTANNAIQCIAELNGSNFTTLKSSSYALAAIDGMYGEADQIHEVNFSNAAKYLFIGLGFQGYSYFNQNTVKLLKNAADYLTNPSISYDYGNKVPGATPHQLFSHKVPAFPGAEGGAMFISGGRGGTVYYVTNLSDDPNTIGSLRWAINKTGRRIVQFKISGIIELNSELRIREGNLTIAGQTAPGDGICLKNYQLRVSADNVIIRFIRSRLGTDRRAEDDAMEARNQRDIMIDHCSMSWSIDECTSFYDSQNVTIQWSVISESLQDAGVHSKGPHSAGGIIGGRNISFHHNIFAHHYTRNPRFSGSRYTNNAAVESVDLRNNVIYNWIDKSVYGGEGGSYNIVNNYFKYGPGTKASVRYKIVEPWGDDGTNSQPAGTYGKFYVDGNYVFGSTQVTNNNWDGVLPRYSFLSFNNKEPFKSDTEFDMPPVSTHAAVSAYESVLTFAGASLRKDTVDRRIENEIRKGIATYGNNGLIDSVAQTGGYPTYIYERESVVTDTDRDGIPDYWEIQHGLDPNNPLDANQLAEGKGGYSNLDIYLASIVENITEDKISNAENPLTVVLFTQPANGVLQVKKEENNLISGSIVNKGEILRVTASAADGYVLISLTINGVEVETDQDYVVDDEREVFVVARFESVASSSSVGEDTFVLYPNPVTDVLKIKSASTGFGRIEVFNIAGVLVSTGDVLGGYQEIDVSALSQGIYTLRMSIDNKVETYRFVKK